MTTKEFISQKVTRLPENKARIVAQFLLWLEGEKLTKKELAQVEIGKAEIDHGEYVEWRQPERAKI